jgi:hypothetical protein
MAARSHIYLVPGFFGFANLGELVYFGHARDFLQAELTRRGVSADVVVVNSHPTASLRVRARDLLRLIVDTASADTGPIHLIGHSSGGLDARLMVSPATSLGEDLPTALIAERVKTLVTLSTPHYGTPLASFFTGIFGLQMLELLSLATVYILRFGRLPLPVLFRFGGLLARLSTKVGSKLGWKQTLFEQLFTQLLGDFSQPRQAALTRFFHEVSSDQGLIPQLTPEAMRAFNAATPDRPGVRYGSVVTQARKPSVASRWGVGTNPYAQTSHTVYWLLHRQSSRVPIDRIPVHTPAQAEVLKRDFGRLPRFRASDGIVPTLSQPWGEVIAGAWADHLDSIGHFDQPTHQPPHIDWLFSGSGFRRGDFERVWSAVLDFMGYKRNP